MVNFFQMAVAGASVEVSLSKGLPKDLNSCNPYINTPVGYGRYVLHISLSSRANQAKQSAP